MTLKKIIAAAVALCVSACLCADIFAYGITIAAPSTYSYSVVLSASVAAPLTVDADTLIYSNIIKGSEITLTDKNGVVETGTVTAMTLAGSQITAQEIKISPLVTAENIVMASASYKVAISLTLMKNTTEPSTILDLSSLSIPLSLKFVSGETEKNATISGKITAKIKAAEVMNSVSPTVITNSLNNSRGLRNREKLAIASAAGNITVKAVFRTEITQPVIVSLSTDFSGDETLSCVLYAGSSQAEFSVPKAYLYDADYGEFFSSLKISGCSNPLKLVIFNFDGSSQSNSFSLSADKLTLNAGASYLLTSNQSSYWYSSDRSVATVQRGRVTGVSAGTAIITVTNDIDSTIQCGVTVKISATPITSLKLKYSKCVVRVGKKYTIGVSAVPTVNTDVLTWLSSNPSVASVNSATGKITANAPGTAVITAVASSGVSASCTLTVKMPE